MNEVYEIIKLKQEIRTIEDFPPLKVNSSFSIARWLQDQIGYDTQESLVLLCLDTKHNVTCFSIVHRGTINQSICHPRDIFQRAYLSNATRIVLGHNHPTGDVTPSKSDIDMTRRVEECGEILGVELLDHIIVGTSSYYSFREEGEL